MFHIIMSDTLTVALSATYTPKPVESRRDGYMRVVSQKRSYGNSLAGCLIERSKLNTHIHVDLN